MLLHFYVQGKQPGSTPISEESYLDRASTFATDTCNQASGLTWDDTVSLVQSYVSTQADRLRSVFRYVSGAPALSPTPQAATPAPQAKSASERKSEGFFGLFGSLRGSSQDALEGTSDAFDGESFAEGEVHADLVRVRPSSTLTQKPTDESPQNDEGYFVFRYLLIDLPGKLQYLLVDVSNETLSAQLLAQPDLGVYSSRRQLESERTNLLCAGIHRERMPGGDSPVM